MKLPNLPVFNKVLAAIKSRIQAYRDKKTAKADAQLIDFLVTDLSKDEALVVRTCLTNQLDYINKLSGYPGANTAVLKETMLQLSKRIVLGLLRFRDVIGIQPMTGPAGIVYTMRVDSVDKSDQTTGGVSLSMSVGSHAVEAKTKKLQTGWTLEVAQDLTSQYGLDLEYELIQTISAGIINEYASMIVKDLKVVGGDPVVVPTSETDGVVSTTIDSILVTINQVALNIGQSTKRGTGNVLIMSPMALSALSASKHFNFVKTTDSDNAIIMLTKAGYVSGVDSDAPPLYTVYQSLSPELSHDGQETIIVGYKGKYDCDTAYVLCPYIPFMSNGAVEVDATTFMPRLQTLTRFGTFVPHSNDNNDMYDAKEYYRTITFDSKDMFGPSK